MCGWGSTKLPTCDYLTSDTGNQRKFCGLKTYIIHIYITILFILKFNMRNFHLLLWPQKFKFLLNYFLVCHILTMALFGNSIKAMTLDSYNREFVRWQCLLWRRFICSLYGDTLNINIMFFPSFIAVPKHWLCLIGVWISRILPRHEYHNDDTMV